MFTIQIPRVHGATSDSGVKRLEARKCRYSHVQHLLCEVIRERGYTSISTVVRYTLNNRRTGSGHFNHSEFVFGLFLWSCQWLLKCKRSNQRAPAMCTCKTPRCIRVWTLSCIFQEFLILENRMGKIRLEGFNKIHLIFSINLTALTRSDENKTWTELSYMTTYCLL